jgi:hypothetical protein
MNNFKEYGFEADFEGEILGERHGFYIGFVTGDMLVFKSMMWAKSGKTAQNIENRFNLTPIKKEWYEVESNFPRLIVCDVDDKKYYNTIHTAQQYRDQVFNGGNRLATNEEIDKLKVTQ